MMKRVSLIWSLVVVAMSMMLADWALPAPSSAAPAPAKPIELRFSYQTPPVAWTTTKFLVPWAKKVEEATNGRVKITHYPAQSLHAQTEALEATIGGITDITWLFIGLYAGKFPLSEAGGLPFTDLPSGKLDGRTVGAGEINSRIFQELYESSPAMQNEYSRVKTLFVFKSSPGAIFTTKKPVRNMGDLKGLKIRALAGPPTALFKALGAAPVTVAAPDIYSSLERGILDGCEWAWAGVDSYKLYELLQYWTDQPTTASPYAMIMNLDKWNSLPSDLKAAIMSVSGRYGAEFSGQTAWSPAERENVLNKAKAAGKTMTMIKLDPGEPERWVSTAKPIWNKWIADREAKGLPAQKIFDELFRLIAKYRTP